MEILTTTPFGQRSVTAAMVTSARQARQAASIGHINKWELFRELTVARPAYGVSDRDLTVLNALLSFYPDVNLSDNGALIVYPSNAALSERAHGMAESTLRRHLAALVGAGLIRRHDSPNGKRYAARGAGGEIARAFGFDLRPLLERGSEIVLNAAEARAAADRLRRLREEVMLRKRDAIKLANYGEEMHPKQDWHALQARLLSAHQASRRRLTAQEWEELRDELGDILRDITRVIEGESENMSGKPAHSERQYQNSNSDSYEFEPRQELGRATGMDRADPDDGDADREGQGDMRIPLALVLKACPDILPYAGDDIARWSDLERAATTVRGMMGVSPDAWQAAQRAMGSQTAAVVLVCILQRISQIHSPGGYLRALSRKAEEGAFSPAPMVMALLNTQSALAS